MSVTISQENTESQEGQEDLNTRQVMAKTISLPVLMICVLLNPMLVLEQQESAQKLMFSKLRQNIESILRVRK